MDIEGLIFVSKQCSKCGATNYDSATICTRCGSLFRDGAYSLTTQELPEYSSSSDKRNKMEKSSKALILIIVSVIVIITVLVVLVCVYTFGGGFSEKTDYENQENAVQTEEFEPKTNQKSGEIGNKIISGLNNLTPEELEQYIPVAEIKVSESEIKMKPGESANVSAQALPENAYSKTLYWEAEDSGVAYPNYDEGASNEIVAVAEGTTVISVYAAATDPENPAIAQIKVTITSKNDETVIPDQEVDYGEYYVNANTYLSLRRGPGTDYKELLRISKNEIVRVMGTAYDDNNDEWYFIHYKSKVGWVMARFLTEYDGVNTEE